jgi:transposase
MVTQFEDLSDSQWQVIQDFLPVKRKRKLDLRLVVNAILWLVRTGSQWRNLDSRFPKWTAVYWYFYKWTRDGTLEKMNACLNEIERKNQGREPTPSLTCTDSQSVKLAPMIFEDRGKDGGKLVNGRKRQVMVDTLGLVWGSFVHAANLSDTVMGCELFEKVKERLVRLKKILVDSGYKGTFVETALAELGVTVEISSRPPTEKGFVPIAKRWVSERTFGWFNFFRRLCKDYEHTTKSAEGMILLANCSVILNRIGANSN